jgi:hypothetical protein
VAVEVVDTGGTFENLDDGSLSVDLQNLSLSDGPIAEDDVDDLCVPW